ncbi:MAG: putative portal protein [Prokaryotic dsDNA virus sp.]|nr:MAG: putative portal protein [Prokaryotic dsDNA virus sp.]|tara:strand:+ start:10356 stop:12452 length:2097 start_codon:yes stop_codon:yes gene_type:complete
MASDKDNNEHRSWLQQLGDYQESDLDQRQQAREADRFLLDKDGQWEESVARNIDSQKRPRYTFDRTTPIIESIMSDVEDMEFGSNVKPASGEATKEIALTYEGMVRAIEAESKAGSIYRNACRRMIRRGFDAWIVKAKFKDEWSFDQDLVVEAIPNAINRVWTSNTSVEPDSSDTDAAYVLTSVSPEEYKKQFPDGKGISVGDADLGEHWDQYRPEVITFGERYYKKETKRTVCQLSNGEVVEKDDNFEKVADEYAQQGVTVVREKEVKDYQIYHRFFDGGGMLSKERETVFRTMPVVTVYGNHELLGESSKITYSGLVLKMMDYQRVFNYGKSREIEEGALAPRKKLVMSRAMAKGSEKQIAALNVSADPVLFLNPDPEMPQGVQELSGSQVNPHLTNISADMAMGMRDTANVSEAMEGKSPARMSEEALRLQVDRGIGGTKKWVNALVNGIERTCKILVQTIPTVYDTKRTMAITGADGAENIVTLNDEVYDNQSGEMVRVNTLNKGKYKVSCDAGKAFANKLEAGRAAMLELAAVDPSILQTGGDLLIKSMDAPYMNELGDRKRAQMLQAGMIPFDQMTDEEKQAAQQAAQQPKEPSPEDKIANAELIKANNEQTELALKDKELNIKAAEVQQKGHKLSIEEGKAVADIRNKDSATVLNLAKAENTATSTELDKYNAIIDSLPTDDLLGVLSGKQ